MGRFYKTSPGQFLDFMYQLPKEQMLKGIEMSDAQITKTEDDLRKKEEQLKLDSIDADTPEAKRIIAEKMGKIDTLARQLNDNPLDFRRETPAIRALGREITEEWTYGNASKIQANYNQRKAHVTAQQEMLSKHPDDYTFADVQKLQALDDQEYAKADEQGNLGYQKGRGYNARGVVQFQDIYDADKMGQGYKPELVDHPNAWIDPKDGRIYTYENSNETVDPKLIKEDIKKWLNKNQKLNSYLDQQVDVLGNMTRQEVDAQKEELASTIGEKYGYNRERKGITSVKEGASEVASATWLASQPALNQNQNTFSWTTLPQMYGGDPNAKAPTVGIIQESVKNIATQQTNLLNTAKQDLQVSGVTLTGESLKAFNEGNFKFFKGKGISDDVLLGWQNKYETASFHKQILEDKLAQAKTYGTGADAYLAKETRDKVTQTGTFGFGNENVLSPKDAATLVKGAQAYGEEADENQAVFDSKPWQMSPKVLEDFNYKWTPPQGTVISGKTYNGSEESAMTKGEYMFNVKEGQVSKNDLIDVGIIERKVSVTGEEMPDTTGMSSTQRLFAQPTKSFGPTNAYQNFELNGKNIKPSMTLNGDGKIIAQITATLDGKSLTGYIPNENMESPIVTASLNMPLMNAQLLVNTVKNNIAIPPEKVVDGKSTGGYPIKGIKFYPTSTPGVLTAKILDSNGVAIHTMTESEAVEYLAAKSKKEAEEFKQQQ